MNEIILQEIDELRGEITMCQAHTRVISANINRGTGGREVALAYTSLQQAQSWLRYAVEEMMPGPISERSEDKSE